MSVQEARHAAHQAFDEFWKKRPRMLRGVYRCAAYRWLRRATGMSRSECHIGNFDVGMCEAVIELCQEVKLGIRDGPRAINNPCSNHRRRKKLRARHIKQEELS